MLIFDSHKIGNKLLAVRKGIGLTQSEVAEKAGISDRTYADIERGSVNMRVETVLKICSVFNITPDEVLTSNEETSFDESEILEKLSNCSVKERQTALNILGAYLESLGK